MAQQPQPQVAQASCPVVYAPLSHPSDLASDPPNGTLSWTSPCYGVAQADTQRHLLQ